MATGGGGIETYARRAGKGIKKKKKLNILDITLERKDVNINYNLSKEELSKLLFRKMRIDPKNIVKIDTSAFRTIHVELAPEVEPESFAELPAFEIRDGLRSKIYRPHHRKDTLVTVSWLDLETSDELVSHVFSHFGTLKSNIKWCKIKQENEESEEAKLLNNILSGERQLWIELDRSLPSYASIDGRKVKIFHAGQKRTCARCQKDGENCPGKANAKLCGENGGEKIQVEVVWKDILNAIGYIEWNGEESADVIEDLTPVDGLHIETEEADDIPPIDGCTGLVIDNLEENMTIEDIKTLLKKACSDETLKSCTLHPTGSLRSKIVQNLDTSLIPLIAKKLDKQSFMGRMIFCKPYVPKTPQKEENPSNRNENPSSLNETNRNENPSNQVETPSNQIDNPSNQKETLEVRNENPAVKTLALIQTPIKVTSTKPKIPGLPEQERIKALKTKEKKGKEKKTKEDRKNSKEENLDIKNLSQQDFLLKPNRTKADDKTKDFQFSDAEEDSDAFEDSKEDLEAVDPFSTPITLKSTFAKNVARSESRSRSRSVSSKRGLTVDAEDENKKKTKSLKSCLPTVMKNVVAVPKL